MQNPTEFIGLCAAILTTVAFAPQVVRTWRMGGNELSWLMLGLFGIGVTLWFVYGWLLNSMPLLLANGLTLAQVAVMAGVKFAHGRRRQANTSP